MFTNPLARVRVVGIIEAISFLLLLGIAMPLKYLADRPEAVQVIGMAHGVLWILYLAVLALAVFSGVLALRTAGWGVVASVLPFGPFVYDAWLTKQKRDSVIMPDKA